MAAHISCRPWSYENDAETGCFVVCTAHDLKQSFGSVHAAARAACIEHNALHHRDEGRRTSPLLSVVYESWATEDFRPSDLQELLVKARRQNRAFGITGMLLAEDGRFLQALEGPAAVVENLMRSIQRDPRHDRVRVLSTETGQRRRFPDWAMAEGHIDEVESSPLAQYYEVLLRARGDVRDR